MANPSQPNSQTTSGLAAKGSAAGKFPKVFEDGEASSRVSGAALSNTIARLKKNIGVERQSYVKAKMEANSERVQMFCTHMFGVASERACKSSSLLEKDLLNTRIQKALAKLSSDPTSDQQGAAQEDSSAPILLNASGGKSVVKPIKLQALQRTPPYTTWIFLDRNQRMAEDQSVVGRRRIYYDTAGNEALICSDSEEELVDEDEEKREFSRGDDYMIKSTVQEHGMNKMVLKTLCECLDAKVSDIEARYEHLRKESEKSDASVKQEDEKPDLISAMDSFDNLFCRRCLVFDCRLHGCSQPLVTPSDKHSPMNNTGDSPSESCGPSCFHLTNQNPNTSAPGNNNNNNNNIPVVVIPPPAVNEEKKSITVPIRTVDELEKHTDPTTTTKLTEIQRPPETPRKGIRDKSVSALRKLLKRTAGRNTNEDSNDSRKKPKLEAESKAGAAPAPAPVPAPAGGAIVKREGEASSSAAATGASAYLKRLVSKKLLAQRKWKANPVPKPASSRPLMPANKLESPIEILSSSSGKENVCDSNWNQLENELYEKGLQIFGRDSCLIARNMLKGFKTCAEVGQMMQLDPARGRLQQGSEDKNEEQNVEVELRTRPRLYNGRRKGRVRRLKYTWKSVGYPAIRKKLVDGKEGCRQYTPCSCLNTCGKQCSCHRNGTCCEKYCGCSKTCKNRFRGCHCAKSQCSSRQCPCFAAGRECDPDVCRNCWIGCGDGTQALNPARGEAYKCRNMKLLLKQQQRVLLGRSDVAGWGAFLKSPVNKHEYLGEYTGELISHREADKRGKIYDRENSSFLFNLNDQYVLDACRKGDKLKFANHSPNPNCYAKVIMVAGDHRVGIFAKERMAAGEELFYDYRYEADRAPAWARKPDEAHKHDEPGNASGRAQKTA